MELQFSVNKQIISRIDKEKVVADSRKLISLKFTFTEEWDSIIAKTAIITTDNHSYYVNINTEGIVLAEEMPIIKKGLCYFSVFAGYVEDEAELQTANELFIDVIPSGLKEEAPAPPTPSKYDEIKRIAENAETTAQKVRDDADEGLFNGMSAYEVWLAEGNIGTQQEFLISIKGLKGDTNSLATDSDKLGGMSKDEFLQLDQTVPQTISKVGTLKVEGYVGRVTAVYPENIPYTIQASANASCDVQPREVVDGYAMLPITTQVIAELQPYASVYNEIEEWYTDRVFAINPKQVVINLAHSGVTSIIKSFEANSDGWDSTNTYVVIPDVDVYAYTSDGIWTAIDNIYDNILWQGSGILSLKIEITGGTQYALVKRYTGEQAYFNTQTFYYSPNTVFTYDVPFPKYAQIILDLSNISTVVENLNTFTNTSGIRVTRYSDVEFYGSYINYPMFYKDILNDDLYYYMSNLVELPLNTDNYYTYTNHGSYLTRIDPPLATIIDKSILEVGVLKSVATFEAPLQVASSVMVENLNVEKLGGYTYTEIIQQLPNQSVNTSSSPSFKGLTITNSVGATKITVDGALGLVRQNTPRAMLIINGGTTAQSIFQGALSFSSLTGFQTFSAIILTASTTLNRITLTTPGSYRVKFYGHISCSAACTLNLAISKSDTISGYYAKVVCSANVATNISYEYVYTTSTSNENIKVCVSHTYASAINLTVKEAVFIAEYIGI